MSLSIRPDVNQGIEQSDRTEHGLLQIVFILLLRGVHHDEVRNADVQIASKWI